MAFAGGVSAWRATAAVKVAAADFAEPVRLASEDFAESPALASAFPAVSFSVVGAAAALSAPRAGVVASEVPEFFFAGTPSNHCHKNHAANDG